MSWRTNLQQASFRGIPFKVESSDTGVGRRTEMHVYANTIKGKYKDYVWAKDLGSEPDSFTIEGYVIQNISNGFDYFTERDDLIKALKTKGPGILIHPFYKESMRVSVDGKVKISESITKDGGIAKFTINFVQYNEPIFSQLDTDFVNVVDTSALKTINAALDNFTSLMNTAGAFLNTLAGPIITTMNKVQNAVNSVKGAVASTISAATGIISTAISLINGILTSPCDLINTVKDAVDSILGLVGMAGEVVTGGIVGGCTGTTRGNVTVMDGTIVSKDLGISVCESGTDATDYTSDEIVSESIITADAEGTISTGGSLPDEQSDNMDLITVTSQSLMLCNVAMIAIRIDFSSENEMLNLLDKISTAFDNLLYRIGELSENVDDPLLYQSVQDLRSTFVKSLINKNVGLVKEIQYEVPTDVISTLELAYNKYEDVNRCAEIFSRNKGIIKHPGFMPNGEEINILNE